MSVCDVETFGSISVNVAWWRETVALTETALLYVLAPVDGVGGRHWRARTFAPGLGIAEDPATGSAAAAAAGTWGVMLRPSA